MRRDTLTGRRVAACSTSASEAKILQASVAASTRSTHTLYTLPRSASALLNVDPSAPDSASPFASARQHQPSATAALIRRRYRAFRPRNVREPRQSPRVMSPLTQHTATYLRYQHMSLRVLGLPTLT